MEKATEPHLNFLRTSWFVFGYFAAIGVIYCAERLSAYLSSLESSGVIVSPNGTSQTERDEKVAEESVELIREYTNDE